MGIRFDIFCRLTAKIVICLSVFLTECSVTPLLGQRSAIDSLRKVYQQERDPAIQLDVYYEMALAIKEKNLEEAAPYADTLASLAKAQWNRKAEAHALDLRADILYDQGDVAGALPLYRQELGIYTGLGDLEGQGEAYNALGFTYKELQQTDSAMIYYLKAAEVKEKTGNQADVASAYSNIGNLYVDRMAYDKGIEFLLKSLKIREELGDPKRLIYTYNNLAVAYGTKGDIQPAMEYAQKGIDLSLKQDNRYVAGVISGGIGHLLNEQQKYEEALRWCERSIAYLKEANRRPNLVYPLVNMATAYNRLGNYPKALAIAEEGYAIMLETKQVEPLEVYYEEMATAHEKMGHYGEALSWFKKFMALDDSLFKADNVRNMAEIEARYQTKKKEAEITAQQLQLSEQQRMLFRQRTWIIALWAGIGALLALGYLFYTRYRLRQKAQLDAAVIREQRLGINAVIEGQEAERRRIAKDLHDGIAQELVALKLGLAALQRQLTQTAPAEAGQLNVLTQQLDASCTEVRNLSHVMVPPTLEQHGLAPSIELLLRNSVQHIGIQTHFEYYGLPPRLEEKVEVGVYRIAQELLNNVVKHADAERVGLQLYQAGGNLILKVEDNGKSFDFEAARNRGSMGLLNILSRVSNLGGTFFSEPGQPSGTVSTVRIPL